MFHCFIYNNYYLYRILDGLIKLLMSSQHSVAAGIGDTPSIQVTATTVSLYLEATPIPANLYTDAGHSSSVPSSLDVLSHVASLLKVENGHQVESGKKNKRLHCISHFVVYPLP